ncbi:MBL fold metallo-hydrolase [Pseudomonas sp. CCI1.2]|uniref:MBL fold metallo-hydrolase n=1 Tax=Pseudomonas sp. CCI1.2 TaxID=3048614 RepID=UPI002B22C4BB|nr:MBL fold metallo-hydrolase [Pseudomonas sp. CCI1.2]MEB0120476.1 MBL fold metallo-hydrolase [Pseudomonas sp. CCI1.2]
MLFPEIIHHGATQGVTGSCHQLFADADHSFLVDCGLFQGSDVSSGNEAAAAQSAVLFSLNTIKALIVTHVHADHIGRIPQLLAAGFSGPILCSEPSAHLMPLVLEDAFRHQFGRTQKDVDQYLELIAKRTIALPFNTWFDLVSLPELTCRMRLQRDGHVLGSAYVECDMVYHLENRQRRVVFSGDLGAPHTPILPSPQSPERADVLILESTYGDRLHEDRTTRQLRLEQAIDSALEDNGTILIPAFSLGRTQELLYEIEDILHRKALADKDFLAGRAGQPDESVNWPQLPIILDSPLASRITKVYQQFDDIWDSEASARTDSGRTPLTFSQLITIDSHDQHLRTVNYLSSTGRPAIVIAGHGMCAGGRVVNYLKAMLGDSRHNVIFVGYQAKGTPGAALQAHGASGGYVELDKERYVVRAAVTTLGGYSAHADQQGLVDFVTGMEHWPSEIRLVHGEASAKKALSEVLRRKYSLAKREGKVVIAGK